MPATPRELGYHMPAEWEPHQATWLSWPHNPETWPGQLLAPIVATWAQMAAHLSHSEWVYINVLDQPMLAAAKKVLEKFTANLEHIRFFMFATNDAWVRDHGPVFVTGLRGDKKALALIDWEYNSWGGKYPCDQDNEIPSRIAAVLNIPCFKPGLVMEGGSIDVNGRGTLLTTESCLLHPNRNPQLSRAEIEQALKDNLGVTHILWLKEGIAGDDTDGHIDDLARFVNPTTVVTIVEDDPQDANYKILETNYKLLTAMRDQDGRSFTVVKLPTPGTLAVDSQRVPASYANFYIANTVVLVPVFDHPNDGQVLHTLQKLFPERQVIGIDCRAMVWGLGTIHCSTQQMPSVF